ncbi:3'(2'),5'-bisphosphate nucleotidase [Methylocystis bryophila]|uniref:3'(2'),5'-bisphosphate nucleotidase CysQ n=1 Tax=Methylocystis bryophila TaxID=655015 RepID=A0A1W6MVQ5_9HYPH|nr:3'(2'),5'-bisphosphate nucleotidase CysQ [Methylocystis bryophila]ARN81655.1 3'(2'),5'-bisphosphate nucleotidase [Methylocystis bryophila]
MPPLLPPYDRSAVAILFAKLCLAAGPLAMDVFNREDQGARLKDDASPVTEADEAVEAYLLAELARLMPNTPCIAEESAARGETPTQNGAFILIDPLDGTREFVARRLEFTINIALVEQGEPRAGAVYAPALGELWFGGEAAFHVRAQPGEALPEAAQWRRLAARPEPKDGLVAMVSLSHFDAATESFLARLPIKAQMQAGSSLKFCRIAEGLADVYPRFGPTHEWDTAAGDAVLRAAGGAVLTPGGDPFVYGKAAQNYCNGPYVACGDRSIARFF